MYELQRGANQFCTNYKVFRNQRLLCVSGQISPEQRMYLGICVCESETNSSCLFVEECDAVLQTISTGNGLHYSRLFVSNLIN